MANKGTRWIDGREYLLCGREVYRDEAISSAARLRQEWERVRVIKMSDWDWMLYVHAKRPERQRPASRHCGVCGKSRKHHGSGSGHEFTARYREA